jgi:hypothetical protein
MVSFPRKCRVYCSHSHSTLGMEYNDTVTLGPNLVIHDQGIGVAQNTSGVTGSRVDGILG